MNTECLRNALKQHKTAEISVGSGVCIATIDAIKSGRNKYPTTRTVEKLRAYMEKAVKKTKTQCRECNEEFDVSAAEVAKFAEYKNKELMQCNCPKCASRVVFFDK